MYYLSHYYTELPRNEPYFVAALAIPDLCPGFSKSYNQKIKRAIVTGNPNLELVQSGIISHYEGDKRFHNSEAFKRFTAQMLQYFLSEGLSREKLRLSVIAHLAVEMMIDRQIVLEYEHLCVEYYNTLICADERVLTLYFDRLGMGYEKSIFLSRFRIFRERRFLLLFKNMENVPLALSRVYSPVGGAEFTEEERAKFTPALNNIDEAMRYSWKQILKG